MLPLAEKLVRDFLSSLQITGTPQQTGPGSLLTTNLSPSLQTIMSLSSVEPLADLELLLEDVVLTLADASPKPPGVAALDLSLKPVVMQGVLGGLQFDGVTKNVEFTPVAAERTAQQLNPAAASLLDTARLVPTPNPGGVPPYTLGIAPNAGGTIENFRGQVTLPDELKGAATGTINAVTAMTGTIAGKIIGKLTKPSLLKSIAKVRVRWTITSNGTAVEFDPAKAASSVRIMNLGALPTSTPQKWLPDLVEVNGKSITELAPLIVPLPQFEELRAAPPGMDRLEIRCTVELDVTYDDPGPPPQTVTETVTHGLVPVYVDVPRVPVPTLLLVTEHAVGDERFPGHAAMIVPVGSVLENAESAMAQLAAAQNVISTVNTVLGVTSPFSPTTMILQHISKVVLAVPTLRMWRADSRDQIDFLVELERIPSEWFAPWKYRGWDDVISSIALFGPPGRYVSLHGWENTWWRGGVIQISLGPTCCALFAELGGIAPALTAPAPSGTEFETSVKFHDPISTEKQTYNDNFASLRFKPVGYVEPD